MRAYPSSPASVVGAVLAAKQSLRSALVDPPDFFRAGEVHPGLLGLRGERHELGALLGRVLSRAARPLAA